MLKNYGSKYSDKNLIIVTPPLMSMFSSWFIPSHIWFWIFRKRSPISSYLCCKTHYLYFISLILFLCSYKMFFKFFRHNVRHVGFRSMVNYTEVGVNKTISLKNIVNIFSFFFDFHRAGLYRVYQKKSFCMNMLQTILALFTKHAKAINSLLLLQKRKHTIFFLKIALISSRDLNFKYRVS